MKLFVEFTPWEILEIFSHKNAYYCLQVRANKENGIKQFRTTLIVETESSSQMRNINVDTINRLVNPDFCQQPAATENIIKTVKGGKMKLLMENRINDASHIAK